MDLNSSHSIEYLPNFIKLPAKLPIILASTLANFALLHNIIASVVAIESKYLPCSSPKYQGISWSSILTPRFASRAILKAPKATPPCPRSLQALIKSRFFNTKFETPNFEIRKKNKVFAKWRTLETGKTLAEGGAEVGAAADIFEWNAEETKRIYGQSLQSRFDNTKIQIIYQPVGVVAALSPWNFPLVLTARKVSAALAAGCSVICKPDVITPGTVMEMVDIIKDCGVSPGAVNLLSGDPAAITAQ